MHFKQRDGVDFQFTNIFDPSISQERVFDEVCLDIVHSALDGYNGTILAYGQTGSGKTYTITGGEHYADRGIIPRVLSTIFEEFEKRPNMRYSCYISYLEIYNENVYDLLDRSHTDRPIEEWTKVLLMDDDEGDMHFRNLGVFEAISEEEALNLLFLGNMNRVTSDTPMNQVILSLRSKRNAVSKTYHVPYRNSMLTSVLRGSLGGNCKSVFIATLNPESDFVDESISTCRFMQRCSEVTVDVAVNSEIDTEKRLETVEKVNAELERTNAELQARAVKLENDIETQALQFAKKEEQWEQRLALTQEETQTALEAAKSARDQSELSDKKVDWIRCEEIVENLLLTGELPREELDNPTPQDEFAEARQLYEIVAKEIRALGMKTALGPRKSGSDLIRKRMELLRTGSLFVKYGRYGKPHVRFVWCSADLEYLNYRAVESTNPKATIPTRSIKRVCIGQETRVFERAKQPARAPHCFSIEYEENRTLDLEIADGESPEVKQTKRGDWAEALQFLIKLKSVPRRTKSQSLDDSAGSIGS
ncbi:hypothetical protein BBJ29_003210 [Phytophthora kernoviae]|uniref:Kinesin motor domain-containing protein n=1 Tax=Phytophthora kernoviae TaxID=325452 RepID=A0A3F2RUK8_9STRA|nr:hypothetical protein BBJ29_003210 [Phytophthora kernoviae]RLN64525.1 hypothetical protein BBP00_00003404 [Phytophthora kernoviae]